MNTKLFTKILSFALVAVMLLPCLASCNLGRNDAGTTTADTSESGTPDSTSGDNTADQTDAPATDAPGTDAPAVNTYEKEDYLLEEHHDRIKITGRSTVTGNGISVCWSASGIEFNADCKDKIVMRVKTTGSPKYSVFIDGKLYGTVEFVSGTKNYDIAEGLTEGMHNVRLVKMTDVESVESFIRISVNGLLTDRPADKKYFVEIVGDSITCGYGLGTKGNTFDNDAVQSWAYLLAQKRGWDYSLVSVGGIGVAASTERHEGREMGDLYPYTFYKDTKTEYTTERKADLVIIALNTNDNGRTSQFTQSDYEAKVKELVAAVKKVHGDDVTIAWVSQLMFASGTCDTWVREVFRDLGGEAAGYYCLSGTPDSKGQNSHPTSAGQAKNASIIDTILNIKKLLPAK